MQTADRPLLLVVDDEEWARISLRTLLEQDGYSVAVAASGREAAKTLRDRHYDMLIVDLMLGDDDGLDLVRQARKLASAPEVLVVTGFGSVETAVEAIKLGAYDYLTKPLDSKRVLHTVAQAVEKRRLECEVTRLRRQVREALTPTKVVFTGARMKRVLELVAVISRTDSTVLIEGESGTGKDLIARMIHEGSPRAGGPFLTVNCGALPEQLLESELFGHVRGAFTGAVNEKSGLFAEAAGGTILLDEIGELPLATQVKLLRVLQDGELRKVGSTTIGRVDVRVVAATNRDLRTMVADSLFREDLFYRLNVIPLTLPPLRERKEDIVTLAEHFLARFDSRAAKTIRGFRPAALRVLMEYDWPGNVRELANVVERAVALSNSEWIGLQELALCFELDAGSSMDERILKPRPAEGRLASSRKDAEKEEILIALQASGWNMTKTAVHLGISRTSLWRKIRDYGLRT